MASADARNDARLAAKAAADAAAKKPLTQAEIDAATAKVVAAGGKSTDRANRLEGETAAQANARITAAYKAQAKPELTVEGKAAGATIEFVRTGAGGVGTYKEVFPMGAAIHSPWGLLFLRHVQLTMAMFMMQKVTLFQVLA